MHQNSGAQPLNLQYIKVLGFFFTPFRKRSDCQLSIKRASVYFLFTLLLTLVIGSQQSFSQEIVPETLVLTVYPDGFVFVDYTVQVDPTFPTNNVTVFGQILEDLLIVDNHGLPLEYSKSNSNLSVYSLGSAEIRITYFTQDITSKIGRYWTLNLISSVKTRIILPVKAAIISLNKVPDLIETEDDRVTLLVDLGLIEVTYVVGVIGTEEHAQIVLNNAEQVIIKIKNFGIKVNDAEIKLQEAETAFNLGNYASAETLGNEAELIAIDTNQTAAQAQSKITEAENTIAIAQNEERILGLNEAQDLLNQAKNEYNFGNYSEGIILATQAIIKAEGAKIFFEVSETFPVYEIIVALLVSGIVIFSFLFLRSKKKPEVKEKKRRIDVERIFREHKDLMPEEKQAIQFLVDNNGECFEAELYDYVKLPRTTTWRMVKRLKGMTIITVTKFRRQNLVRLKNRYDMKE